jgi:hypothetical protein
LPEETELTKLTDLVPDWLKDSGSEKCLVQLFVSFFDLNNSDAMSRINGSYGRLDFGYPAFLRVVELRALKLVLPTIGFSKPRDGVLHWSHKIEEKDLEPGVYVILGAPFDSENSKGKRGEYDARVALASVFSMVSMLYGTASLYSMKCEFVIDIQSGAYSVSSPVIENPAFFKIDHVRDIPFEETFNFVRQLAAAPIDKKNLIAVALGYVNRAVRELNGGMRLAQYFSAIEVLAGGISKNEICKLLKISNADLERMRYNDLYRKRNHFMHEGKAVKFEREEERTLQYLILDIVGVLAEINPATYAAAYSAAVERLDVREYVRTGAR